MIGEAMDAAWTLGWALLAWILAGALVVTVVVLAVGAVVGWAARAAWRGLTRALRTPQPSQAPRVHPESDSAPQDHLSHSGRHDHQQAA